MKKLFLWAVVVALSANIANAQDSADNQNAEQLRTQSKVYCELLGHAKLFSQKVNVEVDFGQHRRFFHNSFLVDEQGRAITFNSMVDAMNHMGKLGWEFEQAYVVTVGSVNVYHWLLSKYITNDEVINEGFTTGDQFKKMQRDQEEPSQKESSQETDDMYR